MDLYLQRNFKDIDRGAPRGKEGGLLPCPKFWLIFGALFLVSYFVRYFDQICALFPWNQNSKIAAIWNNLESIISIILYYNNGHLLQYLKI